MGGIFGITGTPGTGKKTIAPLVASKLGVPCFSLNELAASSGSFVPGSTDEVDTEALKVKLPGLVGSACLLYGHLIPYVLGRTQVTRVVVLRCEPRELKRRLMARGYAPANVVENVEGELIGVVSEESVRAFGRGRTCEFETTSSSPEQAAGAIARLLKAPGKSPHKIDWVQSYGSAYKLRSLLS